MRVCLLASGSKGNSMYVEAGETRILVDAGLSAAEVRRRLAAIGVDPGDIHAIFVTHEHTDHVRGAGVLARKSRIPVIVSYPTRDAASRHLEGAELVEFESGHSFAFRDILIDPFPITHDAVDPVGLVIDSQEGRVAIATDLGIGTRLVGEKLKKARALVLEFNHDEELLRTGPYPWHLKQRIRSRHGHLSNVESAELLAELLHEGLEALFLAHLSETNNRPDIAHRVALEVVSGKNVCNPKVEVGAQDKCTRAVHL